MEVIKANFKKVWCYRVVTTFSLLIILMLCLYFTVNLNIWWYFYIFTGLILVGIVVNIIDWYFQIYIIKRNSKSFFYKLMQFRNSEWNELYKYSEQINFMINNKKEWILYCQAIIVFIFFFVLPPFILFQFLSIGIIFLILSIIFMWLLIFSLYTISYNNKHIKYASAIALSNWEFMNYNKNQKSEKKNFSLMLKAIIKFVPVYLGLALIISYLGISYYNLMFLYTQPLTTMFDENTAQTILFFKTYNYIHILIFNFVGLLLCIWLMQLMVCYELNALIIQKNIKRLVWQALCFLNLFVIIILLFKRHLS